MTEHREAEDKAEREKRKTWMPWSDQKTPEESREKAAIGAKHADPQGELPKNVKRQQPSEVHVVLKMTEVKAVRRDVGNQGNI